MTSKTRPEEAVCFELFRRVTGHAVTPNDHSGRQGAVDGVLSYPDGRTASVEVTSTAAAGRRQLESVLGSDDFKWPCRCTWRWVVSLENPRDIPRAKAVLQTVIDACEAAGASRPAQLPHDRLIEDDDLRWAAESSVLFHGVPMIGPEVNPDGTTFARVHPGAIGGWPGEDGFATFDTELCEVLASEAVRRRLEKVAAADSDERHLMIAVHLTAFSYPVVDELMTGSKLPPERPTCLPRAVTHLWLVPQYGKRVLVFALDHWSSHEVFD